VPLLVEGEAPAPFSLTAKDQDQVDWFERASLLSAAQAFLNGDFEITGDLPAAVRYKRAHAGGLAQWFWNATARLRPWRIEALLQSKSRAARNVRYHYDRPDAFYRCFLDRRMVYSCAYFRDPSWPLERAQEEKLDLICRKLDLKPGERFVDVGCGWGALLFHAARHYGASATGCTLSPSQAESASAMAEGFHGRIKVHLRDYRELEGTYDKIASVGMYEHVGIRRLPGYFRTIHGLLASDGLFLNHGIVRPQGVHDDAESLFLSRHVFPGGELPRLAQVVKAAEEGGFEVLDAENLRPHYALTCRAWLQRLQENRGACLKAVDAVTYRTWLLYLAGSASGFEDGQIDIFQLLLAKRSHPGPRRMSREYMYRATQGPGSGSASSRNAAAPRRR